MHPGLFIIHFAKITKENYYKSSLDINQSNVKENLSENKRMLGNVSVQPRLLLTPVLVW